MSQSCKGITIQVSDDFMSPSIEINRTFEYDYQKTVQKCDLGKEFIMAVGNVFVADITKYEYKKYKNQDISKEIEKEFDGIEELKLSL